MRGNFFKISKYEEKHVNLGGLNRFSYVQFLVFCTDVCMPAYVCSWCTVVSLLLYGNPQWAYKPTDADVSLPFPPRRQ